MKDGEKVYQDKVIGAEFLEFLRERLILAREILANDGVIYVHLDGKRGHYVKILLNKIFGENNFKNEIVWCYQGGQVNLKDNLRKNMIAFFSIQKAYSTFLIGKILVVKLVKNKE
jgi:site-specific DNA-methyltransferase (adenine-specific)/adenine-specific DNA-methyltransferase